MIVAIQELSAGNESAGSTWLETSTFAEDVRVSEIVKWAKGLAGVKGRLIITEPEDNMVIL